MEDVVVKPKPKNEIPEEVITIAYEAIYEVIKLINQQEYLAALNSLILINTAAVSALSKFQKVIGADETGTIISTASKQLAKANILTIDTLTDLSLLQQAASEIFNTSGGMSYYLTTCLTIPCAGLAEYGLSNQDNVTDEALDAAATGVYQQIAKLAKNETSLLKVKHIIEHLKKNLYSEKIIRLLVEDINKWFIQRLLPGKTMKDLLLSADKEGGFRNQFPDFIADFITEENVCFILEQLPEFLAKHYPEAHENNNAVLMLVQHFSYDRMGNILSRLIDRHQDQKTLPDILSLYLSDNSGKKHRKHSYEFIIHGILPYYLKTYNTNSKKPADVICGLLATLKAYLIGAKNELAIHSEKVIKLKGGGNKFLRLLITGINIAFDPTVDIRIIEKSKLEEAVKQTIEKLKKYISPLFYEKYKIFSSIENFIKLPILKEHAIASHGEKIMYEFEVIKNLLQLNSGLDCLRCLTNFKTIIMQSRAIGRSKDSLDLENHLHTLTDKILKILVIDNQRDFEFTSELLENIFTTICNEYILSNYCVDLIKLIGEKSGPKAIAEFGYKLLNQLFTFPVKINKQTVGYTETFYARAKDVGTQIINYLYDQYKIHNSLVAAPELHTFAFAYNCQMLMCLENDTMCSTITLVDPAFIDISKVDPVKLKSLNIDLKEIVSNLKQHFDSKLTKLNTDVENLIQLMKKVDANGGFIPESKTSIRNSMLAMVSRNKKSGKKAEKNNLMELPTEQDDIADQEQETNPNAKIGSTLPPTKQ